ncbi:N-6 DNA methylase [Leifsonia sp. NPDC058194]|uniref:N-6 DNA methylase n=1 Tax=Leifsonia sp. NPDC058194 TaxID=3346374 RepID=UPI0036DCFC78
MTNMKKLLEANAGHGQRRVSQVFRDFCELAALAIRNSVDPHGQTEREERYLSIARGYTSEEASRFAEALAHLALQLEEGFSDALGHLYMSLDLGNESIGQFFTPYDVGLVIAKMNVGNILGQLAEKEFVTVQEPAVGSGGMIIALADALREEGVNYQQSMHVTARDLDITAVHMTYIQLTLINVAAVVVHGNTLTMEELDTWPTPAHVIGGWAERLQLRHAETTPQTVPGHAQRGMGAEDYCTCDGPWPCPQAAETADAA